MVISFILLLVTTVAKGDVHPDGFPSDIAVSEFKMPDQSDLAWCEEHKGEFITKLPADTIMFGAKCVEVTLISGGGA